MPSPGGLLGPWIEPRSPSLWVDSLPSEPPGESLEKGTEVHHKTKNNNQYISEENKNSNLKKYMRPVFTAALFSIAKMWKPPKCVSTD